MKKILSIIIPVYKVEDYIVQCLNSLIIPNEDLFNKLEILIVNDGTPDRSAVLAKEFEKKYPEVFKVIDKENGGHGSAFNVGLLHATGQYLRFLDSDDWFDTEHFVQHLRVLETTEADMVLNPFNYYWVEKDCFEIIGLKGMEYGRVYNMDEFDFIQANNRHNLTNFHCVSYKTALLKPYAPMFAEKCLYDDMLLRIAPVMLHNSFVAYDYPIYNYRVGRIGQSIDPETKRKHVADLNKVCKSVFAFWKKVEKKNGKRQVYIRHLLSYLVYHQVETASRMDYDKSKEILNEIAEILKGFDHAYDKRIRHKMYNVLPFPIFYYAFKVYDAIFYSKVKGNV